MSLVEAPTRGETAVLRDLAILGGTASGGEIRRATDRDTNAHRQNLTSKGFLEREEVPTRDLHDRYEWRLTQSGQRIIQQETERWQTARDAIDTPTRDSGDADELGVSATRAEREVLRVLARHGGRMRGGAFLAAADRSIAAIRTTMVEKGLLATTPIQRAPAREEYWWSLTDAGRHVVAAEAERWQTALDALPEASGARTPSDEPRADGGSIQPDADQNDRGKCAYCRGKIVAEEPRQTDDGLCCFACYQRLDTEAPQGSESR